MDIELVAKQMREDALAKESHWVRKVEELKALQRRIEAEEATRAEQAHQAELKLYFNAGRYSGGARDKTAIEAWHKLGTLDELQ
jgi:hypothetical protein